MTDLYESCEKKFRLLYVVESFSTGVYAVVHDIACNLDPQRFDVLILHSLKPDSPKEYAEDFAFPHITLRYVPMSSPGTYLSAIRTIKKSIKDFAPDAVHLHSSKAGFLGRIAAKGKVSKIFYTPHGVSFIRTDVSPLMRRIFFLLEKAIYHYAGGTILAVSQAERQQMLRITNQVIVIENFIDVASVPVGKEEEPQVVAISGRITEAKNPALFNRIALRMPDTRFLWIGDGPLRPLLTAPNITITGQLKRTEAIARLSSVSLYILTSSWEGMPISLLEAMAMGKASVVSRIQANENVISDGKTGYISDSDDEIQFAERIEELLSDASKRRCMGEAARSYVMEHHDIQRAVERYTMAYLENATSVIDQQTSFPTQ